VADVGNSALKGKRIAFVVANEGVERVELTEPWEAVEEEGGTPRLIAPNPGTVQTFDHLDRSAVFEVDDTVAQTSAEDFDGLVLPGGVANPDQLRTSRPAVDFVRRFFELGRPVAVICHGPWTLVEADVVRGRQITSWPSLRTDIRNAGGQWVDEEVVVCTNGPNVLVSSRRPDDLKAFCGEIAEQF
jgi:protease I